MRWRSLNTLVITRIVPCLCPPSMQRRLGEIERLEAKATAILDEVAQRTGVGEAAESLWAK